MAALMVEEALKEACILNIYQLSLSYYNAIKAILPTLISPPSYLTYLNLWIV